MTQTDEHNPAAHLDNADDVEAASAPRGKPLRVVLIRLALSAALLTLVLWNVDLQAVGETLNGSDWRIVVLAAVIYIARNVFGGWRWRMLLKADGQSVHTLRLTRFYLVGWFYGLFLPTQIGGDVARGVYLKRYHGGALDSTVFSIVVERLAGVMAITVMGVTGLAFQWDIVPPVARFAMLGVAVSIIGLVTVLFYTPYERAIERLGSRIAPKLSSKFARFAEALKRFRSPTLLLRVLLVSGLFQICSIFSTFLLARSLGASEGFGLFLVMVPLVWLSGLLPISFAGFGVREGSFVMLFAAAGMPQPIAAATVLMMSGLMIVQAIVGGVVVATLPERPSPESPAV